MGCVLLMYAPMGRMYKPCEWPTPFKELAPVSCETVAGLSLVEATWIRNASERYGGQILAL